MGMAATIPYYTVEDLERFPRDGNRYELLDGVLLVTPAPGAEHQAISSRIANVLYNAVQAPGLAMVYASGAVSFPPRTQLEPDILVVPAPFPDQGQVGGYQRTLAGRGDSESLVAGVRPRVQARRVPRPGRARGVARGQDRPECRGVTRRRGAGNGAGRASLACTGTSSRGARRSERGVRRDRVRRCPEPKAKNRECIRQVHLLR